MCDPQCPLSLRTNAQPDLQCNVAACCYDNGAIERWLQQTLLAAALASMSGASPTAVASLTPACRMKPDLQVLLTNSIAGSASPAPPRPATTSGSTLRELAAQPLLVPTQLNASRSSRAGDIAAYTQQLLLSQTSCQVAVGLEAGYDFFGGGTDAQRGFVEPVEWRAYAEVLGERLAVVQDVDREIDSAQRRGEALRQLLATSAVADVVREARSALLAELASGFGRVQDRLKAVGAQLASSRQALSVRPSAAPCSCMP